MVGNFEQVKRGVSLQWGGASNNGMRPTADTPALIKSNGAGQWVIGGVRLLHILLLEVFV